MTKNVRPNYWRKFPLDELTRTEWELLCDGCGKCCLIKLEREGTSEIHYTKIACRLFDDNTCKCSNYAIRQKLVSNCLVLTKNSLKDSYHWMPNTCAYRLLYEGKELPLWHHLQSGSVETIHQTGNSVQGITIPEYEIAEELWGEYITKNADSTNKKN